MKIYHGSKTIVNKPIVKGSNPTNDYGPSFYLTTDLETAKAWACRNNTIGFVNCYHVSDEKFRRLKILDLTNKTKYGVLNWIAILMHFRELDSSFFNRNKAFIDWLEKFYIDVNDYDVVLGYRADDSYFRFPTSFINNDLAYEDLEETFMLGKLGVQYAFVSERAINLLRFEKSIECEEFFLGQYYSVVTKASREFNEIKSKPRDPNKTYILDLMREDHE